LHFGLFAAGAHSFPPQAVFSILPSSGSLVLAEPAVCLRFPVGGGTLASAIPSAFHFVV